MIEKFIIVAEIRSGYKLLSALLDSHPNCTCFGEIFGSDKTVRQLSLRKQKISAIEANESPVDWLNTVLFPHNQTAQSVGFKLNYVCAQSTKWVCLWHHMKEDNWKIIHLTRANLLDRLLSQKLAIKENRWHVGNYKTTVNITLDELKRITNRSLKWQEEARNFFKDNLVFELEYNNIQSSIKEIQQFIGLHPKELRVDMNKQRSGNQGTFIDNYKSLCADCIREGGIYRDFLTDIPIL